MEIDAPFRLLDLDDSLLGRVAEVGGLHRKLRATCRRLLAACDLSRSYICITCPCTAGRQLSALRRWPAVDNLYLRHNEDDCKSEDAACKSGWTHAVLATFIGMYIRNSTTHLRCLELQGVEVDCQLLSELLKLCRTSLKMLVLEALTLSGEAQMFRAELRTLKLEKLHLLFLESQDSAALALPKLLHAGNVNNLQELVTDDYGDASVEAWVELGLLLCNLASLRLEGDIPGLEEKRMTALLQGCTSLVSLIIHPDDHVAEALDDGMLAGLACPRLAVLHLNCGLPPSTLSKVVECCKAIHSLGFCVTADYDYDESSFCQLPKLQHLTLDFKEESDYDTNLISILLKCLCKVPHLPMLDLLGNFPLVYAAQVNAYVWQHLPGLRSLYIQECPSPMWPSFLMVAEGMVRNRGLRMKIGEAVAGLSLEAEKE